METVLGKIYRDKETGELFVPYEFSAVENDGATWDTVQLLRFDGTVTWAYAAIFECEDEFEMLSETPV